MRKVALQLHQKINDIIPKTMEGLMELHEVGQKIALLTMQFVFKNIMVRTLIMQHAMILTEVYLIMNHVPLLTFESYFLSQRVFPLTLMLEYGSRKY